MSSASCWPTSLCLRVDQVWTGLYEQLATTDENTNVPKAIRTRLDEAACWRWSWSPSRPAIRGTTVKWLWSLVDGSPGRRRC